MKNILSYGKYLNIGKNVKIGENTELGDFVNIGIYPRHVDEGVEIGKNSIIRSFSIIYKDIKIGEKFRTGHYVLIREKTRIGNNTAIGTNSVIDGNCIIGDCVSIQTRNYITWGTKIEDDVFLGPCVITTNDKYMKNPQKGERAELLGPVIKKYAKIGAGAILLPDIEIGEYSIVGAGSVVTKDVEAYTTVVGNPAKPLKKS